MGCKVKAKCLDCGSDFTVNHGGGFSFHLVRCDECGNTNRMGFKELGELHLRYLKGLSRPYCAAGAKLYEDVQKCAEIEPMSENEYYSCVEAMSGKCDCGGKYTLKAKPRCPKCRSMNIENGEPVCFYD